MNPKLLLALVCAVVSTAAWAQPEKPLPSKITDVTVFLSQAQVTRVASTQLGSGKTNLVFTGLTSQLDPNTVQIKGKGNFLILGTAHRVNYINPLNLPKSAKVLMDSVEYYTRQIAWEQNQKEILNREEQMLLSNQKIGGANSNITVAELKAMADFYRTRLSDIVMARAKADERVKKYNVRIGILNAQINSQNEWRSRNSGEIVVSVSSENGGPAELEVTYIVASAGWVPVYDLRATNTKSPLQMGYKANVFQQTGEEWSGVHLRLSTANPNLGGQKPELYTQYLNFMETQVAMEERYRLSETRSMAKAAMPMQTMDKQEKEAETVSDFVSTIQTTLNTAFDIALPYTVASSAQPTVVDIRQYELQAKYQYAVAPRLDNDAFLMAKATGWEELSLLPGEANIFFEGTFVGKSMVDPASIRDTLFVSLGRDKRIVVKREKVKDFTSRKAIGGTIRETRGYEISVRNNKPESVRIVVEDLVPVSQQSQIEVLVTDIGGASYNKDSGKLTWTWTLAPNESKKAAFKFEVKYPKDRQLTEF